MIGSLISDEQLQSLNSANFIGAVVLNERCCHKRIGAVVINYCHKWTQKNFANLIDYNIYPWFWPIISFLVQQVFPFNPFREDFLHAELIFSRMDLKRIVWEWISREYSRSRKVYFSSYFGLWTIKWLKINW